MYLNLGTLMGPVGLNTNYNGGRLCYFRKSVRPYAGPVTSFELWCNGTTSGVAYHVEVDTVMPPHCVMATNNGPCINDTLKLDLIGDSTAATYIWTGPADVSTSTRQNPFIYPSVFAVYGWYYCTRFQGGLSDMDSTHVMVYPKPVLNVTNNFYLYVLIQQALCDEGVTPSNVTQVRLSFGLVRRYQALHQHYMNPNFTTFVAADTGNYWVYATSQQGCKDTATLM
jgi:hypothetical protein